MEIEIKVYQPVRTAENQKWCADVYLIRNNTRTRVFFGRAVDDRSVALQEAVKYSNNMVEL